MKTMYPAIVNSPQTELAAPISETDTTIPLLDASKLPDAPNLAVIGAGENAETILYTGKSGNDLTGVTRGFQGVAQSWVAGAKVARLFTAYDHEAFMKNIEDQFNLTPSVLKIPMAAPYRAWQGVAVYDDLIYVFTDRDENFQLENIISVYTLDGKLVFEKRNAYTGLDPEGKFMSFGDGNEIDGYLYVTAYNANGGGAPFVSRVLKYSLPNLTLVQEFEIGDGVAESVTKKDGFYWVAYHNASIVRKFDSDFNFLQEYSLDTGTGPYGNIQGSLWEDNYFYGNMHGHNSTGDEPPFAELRKYEFNGTDFVYLESINPPTDGCNQGLAKYGDYYFWNDRPNNMIVISKSLERGRVYAELIPYQREYSFKPTLLNGWQNFDPVHDRPARVTVINGIVYLSGIIKNDNPNVYDGLTPIFKIPIRYAPKYSINVTGLTDKGIVRIPIVGKYDPEKVGQVNVHDIMGYNDISWLSLDGISYPILE